MSFTIEVDGIKMFSAIKTGDKDALLRKIHEFICSFLKVRFIR